MGLDFSLGGARWGYIGFMRFRVRLAAEAGIALHCMEGFAKFNFGTKPAPESVVIFDPNYENDGGYKYAGLIGHQPVIKWSAIKDPIAPFLYHCDCDGHLTYGQCKEMAPRIRELVRNWPNDDYDKINALKLADGMDEAASKKKRLEFT
jgi:hypothetical protein